jgi:hypothetical protein
MVCACAAAFRRGCGGRLSRLDCAWRGLAFAATDQRDFTSGPIPCKRYLRRSRRFAGACVERRAGRDKELCPGRDRSRRSGRGVRALGAVRSTGVRAGAAGGVGSTGSASRWLSAGPQRFWQDGLWGAVPAGQFAAPLRVSPLRAGCKVESCAGHIARAGGGGNEGACSCAGRADGALSTLSCDDRLGRRRVCSIECKSAIQCKRKTVPQRLKPRGLPGADAARTNPCPFKTRLSQFPRLQGACPSGCLYSRTAFSPRPC